MTEFIVKIKLSTEQAELLHQYITHTGDYPDLKDLLSAVLESGLAQLCSAVEEELNQACPQIRHEVQ